MVGDILQTISLTVLLGSAVVVGCEDDPSCIGTIYKIVGIVIAVLVFIIITSAVIFGIFTICGSYTGCLKTTYEPRSNRNTNSEVSTIGGDTNGIRLHYPPPPCSYQRNNGLIGPYDDTPSALSLYSWEIEPYDDTSSCLPPRYSSLDHRNPPPCPVLTASQTKV